MRPLRSESMMKVSDLQQYRLGHCARLFETGQDYLYAKVGDHLYAWVRILAWHVPSLQGDADHCS
jgi:hypothetical protein